MSDDDEVREAVKRSAIASGLAPSAPAAAPSRWVLSTFLSQLERHGYEVMSEAVAVTTYRRFDDIPNGTTFADKFGRMWTKTSIGSARSHEVFNPETELFRYTFDTSRDYYEAAEDELDDCDMWDAWPYYAVPAMSTSREDSLEEDPPHEPPSLTDHH